jgi:uncharacterized membrane protein
MDDLEKIGKILSEIKNKTPEGLSQRVIFAVQRRENRVAKIKISIFGLASAVSIVLLYFAAKTVIGEFYSSGTSQMLSLLFSDFQSVVANLGNYLMSIAESFPILSAVYTLLSLAVFGILTGFAVANVQKFQGLKLNYLKHGYKHN